MKQPKKPALRFKGFVNDWEQRKLEDLASFSKGSGYSKSDLQASGTPIVLYGRLYTKYETVIKDIDTFVDALADSVYSQGGEVIVPASGETAEDISIASVVEKPGIVLGGDLNIIHPTDDLDSTFLAISISHGNPHKEMAKRAQGKSVVHLHNNDLAQIKLWYPSVTEQRKISQYFSGLDTLITLHQRKLEKLQNLKKAMLEKMFPKNGAKVPEIRFKGFTDDWEQRKLGDIVDFLDTQRKPLTENIREKGPYPYYGASGIVDYVAGYIFDEELVLLSEDGANITDRNYPVCFLASGKYWVNNHAHVLKTKEGIDNNFICNSLECKDFSIYNTGMAMPKLNQDICKKIPVDFPIYDEQEKIGNYFRNIDYFITLHQRKLEKLQNLKKAMLEKMFI